MLCSLGIMILLKWYFFLYCKIHPINISNIYEELTAEFIQLNIFCLPFLLHFYNQEQNNHKAHFICNFINYISIWVNTFLTISKPSACTITTVQRKSLESQVAAILNVTTWMWSNFKNRLKCKAIIKNKFCIIYLFIEAYILWLHVMYSVSKYVCWQSYIFHFKSNSHIQMVQS
jgi:hypothetical protein